MCGPNGISYLGEDYDVRAGETVLEALLRQGAKVDYSCRKGSCQTCILKCESGTVTHSRSIDPSIVREGHILSCVAHVEDHVALAAPDPSQLSIAAELVSRRPLSNDIFEIAIAPMRDLPFLAGQHVQVIRADGLARPYSIASNPGADYFFTIHVRLIEGSGMSSWLCRDAALGERFALLPPRGDCHYDTSMQEHPLLLLATGTGLGALAAVARAALDANHRAPIALYHGVRDRRDLYLHDELKTLAARFPNFIYVPCVTGPNDDPDVRRERITTVAFAQHADLRETEVFLCGLPLMIEESRYRATLAGADRARVHADPFDFAHPPKPRDAEKIAQLRPDPELWQALEHGPGLTRILEAFYSKVYQDERLSPFFTGVPKARAVQKQYEFLASIFSGDTTYFGLNPFNAHHWMVISDELFDYRERLFEQTLRATTLAEPLIQRWMAMHELFRADMVKPVARGLFINGVEQPVHTQVVEHLDIDAVCDHCGNEIPAGSPSRYLYRIGALHCARCAGLKAA